MRKHATRWTVVSFTLMPLNPYGESRRYHLITRLDVPRRRSANSGEDKYIFLLPGIETFLSINESIVE
jgi:hypothetical protein